MGSPFEFKQHGQSGAPVSDLFPHVATCVDDLTIVRSMVSDHSEHTAANYFMHSGSGFQGRPSMGGWVVYGLGSECRNLPGFIVLESGLIPPGGLDLFGSGFLPASYQGTLFRKGAHPIADLTPREDSVAGQQAKLGLLRTLNKGVLDRFGGISEVEATISNYELAFRMQSEVPDLLDLQKETPPLERCTDSTIPKPKSSANNACSRVGWWNVAFALWNCCLLRGKGSTVGISTPALRKVTASMRWQWTSRSPRC